MKPSHIKIALITITTLLLGYYFFGSTKTTLAPFETARATKRKLTQTVNSTGTLQPQDQITVGSLVAGRVIEIHADDNDIVKKGQLLMIINDGTDDQSILIAQADYEAAQAEFIYQDAFYQRQKDLFESGQLAPDAFERETRDFERARTRRNATQAKVSLEQQLYDNQWVRSPDDGIVIARKADLGQMITSVLQATELFMIAKDLHFMEAHINVDEADIGLVKVGQPVTFTVDAFPAREYRATVKQINYLPQIKDQVVTYRVILNVANPDLSLRPGMTTNVDIIVAQSDTGFALPNKALRINTASLKNIAQEIGFSVIEDKAAEKTMAADFVWIVENKTFKQAPINRGIMTRRFTESISGVDENSEIVIFVNEANAASKILQQSFGGGGLGKK